MAIATPRVPSTPADIERLRLLVGESIPPGGTELDTLFLDSELAIILDLSETFNEAVARAWRLKATRVVDQAAGKPIEIRYGAESYRFLNPLDYAKWCNEQADLVEKSQPGSGSLWVAIDEIAADDSQCDHLEGSERCTCGRVHQAVVHTVDFSRGDPFFRELPPSRR